MRQGLEYRFQRADGAWRTFFEAGVDVHQTETGETEIYCGVMDITDRRQLQEQLARSQKMELVGQLAGGIAHDFNNMLAVAIGNLELVERKGGVLTIRVRGGLPPEADEAPRAKHVEIAVADTGVGMPPEVIARIFEPFVSTKPVGKGNGLRPSMVQAYAIQQGGRVSVATEPMRGAVVTLRLPEHHGEAPSGAAPVEAAPDRRLGEGLRAVIVDDDIAVRELVVDLLRHVGFNCVEFADADATLRQSALILSDVKMPWRATGVDLAQAAPDLAPEAAVALMTGYAEGQPEALPGRVLNKPFSRDEFYALVTQALHRRGAREAAMA